MKKSILVLAIALLGLVGCKQNEPEATSEPVLRVQFDTPRKGAADPTTTVTRIIMQVIDLEATADETVLYEEKTGADITVTEDGLVSTTFQPSLLLGKKYAFLFWADGGDTYYDATDLRNIKTIADTTLGGYNYIQANDANRDAFYASYQPGVYNGSLKSQIVRLTRPFAQFNVKATDITTENIADYAATEIYTTYFGALNFNVLDGTHLQVKTIFWPMQRESTPKSLSPTISLFRKTALLWTLIYTPKDLMFTRLSPTFL